MPKKVKEEQINAGVVDRALNNLHIDFSLGGRIKYSRVERNMTQGELGIRCGLPEDDASRRIRQYERNERHPKEEILKKLAKELRVSAQMLSMDTKDLQTHLFLTILWADIFGDINTFDAVNDYRFIEDNIGFIDTRTESNVPGITPNSEGPLLDWMQALSNKKKQLKNGVITEEQFLDWELNWEPRYF